MDYGKLLIGIVYGFLGQIFSFLQLQGALKYKWHEKYMFIILLSSIPITWLYIKSVTFLVEGFNGQIWPSRLIGFSIGIVVFTLFSIILFREDITLKTTICLILGIIILLVQLLMK
jgi:hypothetical protein